MEINANYEVVYNCVKPTIKWDEEAFYLVFSIDGSWQVVNKRSEIDGPGVVEKIIGPIYRYPPDWPRPTVGDLVIALYPFQLACGSGIYPNAVVVNTEPLVLVSQNGDMRWDKMDYWEVKSVGRAFDYNFNKANKRYQKDENAK